MNATPVNPNGHWIEHFGHSHISGTEPRIFPGVVRERTRKGSILQGASSEYDLDGNAGQGTEGDRE